MNYLQYTAWMDVVKQLELLTVHGVDVVRKLELLAVTRRGCGEAKNTEWIILKAGRDCKRESVYNSYGSR